MALAQLVYVSRRHDALSPDALEQLVGRSRTRNAERRITGVILSRGPHLLQLLEGDLYDLAALYETIRADPRHAEVYCVMCRNVKARLFPDTGMELAVLDPAGAAAAACGRVEKLVREVASLPDARRPAAGARALLHDIREQLAGAAALAKAA